jgi:acyl-coenzyme A thioesterase PaaI-like protein
VTVIPQSGNVVASSPLQVQRQNACVVCGPDNPHGLQIRFEREADGTAAANWRPAKNWEGFQGIVHGGIISTVLDEAMSKAVAALECEALTGELRVRFRRHVASGEDLHIRGWIVKRMKRLIKTEATLTSADGAERAHAWGTFVAVHRADGKAEVPPESPDA